MSIEIIDVECVLGNLAGSQIEQNCPYKSAILDLSEEPAVRNTMGRVQFCPYKSAILNFYVASLAYLKMDRSTHFISIISRVVSLPTETKPGVVFHVG